MVHQALLSIKRYRQLWFSQKMTRIFSFYSLLYHQTCIWTDMCMCSWHGNHHKMIYEWVFYCEALETAARSVSASREKIQSCVFKGTACCFLWLYIVRKDQLCHCSAIDLLISTFLLCWGQPGISQNDFEMDSVWKHMSDPFRQTHSFFGSSQVYKAPSLFFPFMFVLERHIYLCVLHCQE